MAAQQNKNKIHSFFNNLPKNTRNKLCADNEALYSITGHAQAQLMSEYILQLPGISKESTISDLTACVGGNTINFAINFNQVNAVEINKQRCDMLNHNICTVMKYKNVNIINADLIDVVADLQQDVLFVDPPWGGSEYKQVEYMQLFINGIPLSKIVVDTLLPHAKYIIIKLPLNFDCAEFNIAVKPHAKLTYKAKNLAKMKIVIIEPFSP
mgnify:CR=1 FL=1